MKPSKTDPTAEKNFEKQKDCKELTREKRKIREKRNDRKILVERRSKKRLSKYFADFVLIM